MHDDNGAGPLICEHHAVAPKSARNRLASVCERKPNGTWAFLTMSS